MKYIHILLALCLTGFALQAQTPPPPPVAVPAPATNALSHTNRDLLLRQGLRRGPGGTNALHRSQIPQLPVRPAAQAPASPAPATAPAAAPDAAASSGSTPSASDAQTIAIAPQHPGSTPEETIPPGMIDFRKAEIDQVLLVYADLVNRTVLRPATLPTPTITLRTQTPLTKREAIQALDASLSLNGISMINVGDKFVKAVPQAQANQEAAPFSKAAADQLPEVGQYLTHVVQLKYSKPTELVPALQPFSKIPNAILAIDSSQILVLRDNAENVKRMLELINQIDVAVPNDFVSEVIPIKYAMASDISSALNSLSSGGGGTTVGSSTRSTGSGGSVRTSSGMSRGTTGMTGSSAMGINPMGNTSGYGGAAGGAGAGGAQGGSFGDRLNNLIKRASVSGDIQILGQTKIIADDRTNSLLIYASREDMKTIKDIISKLDIVLAQVLIEAAIIEVTLDKSSSLGVSYQEHQQHGIGSFFTGIGSVNNGNLLTASTNGTTTTPQGLSYLGHLGPNDLDVTLTALASDSNARILQRPRVQTSNAKQASLFVGQTRPYPTGSYYGGGSYGGYSSIQQMQVGVSLEVTPLINPDGLVVMDIHQKIDSVAGTVAIANVGDVPITSSKEAVSSVAVRDHDTIMLGGLIENTDTSNNSGVPYLKDIPLLGFLFRSSSHDGTRNELIVLIRPTVLPTPEVAALAARAEKAKMPGIRKAEAEYGVDEAKRTKQVNHELQHIDPTPSQ